MAAHSISPAAVREALHAIRYARSLDGSPLLTLDLVLLHMREGGIADTGASRRWALGECLQDTVAEQLARLRGARMPRACATPTPDEELLRLRQDLQAEDDVCLHWALLHARYLSVHHRPITTLGATLSVTDRTVRNWVSRGIAALTRVLQEKEAAATRSIESTRVTRPGERIMITDQAEERTVAELLGEILAALRKQEGVVRVTPEQLVRTARYPAGEMVAYRLGRIAEWSQPRYRLDERFVEMSLLVDLGEESQSGRWQAREKRFSELRDVLAAVAEPAVVLLGPPGSGKSTLLRRLELDLAVDALGPGESEAAAVLTFFVSLNQYRPPTPGGELPPPKEWLAQRWAGRFPKLPPLDEVLAESAMVFLLDGLNEMPHQSAEGYRERIALWKQFLHDTVAGGNGHRALIACRSLDYSAPLSTPALRVPQVRLEPLTDERVWEFVRRYSPGNAEQLWGELQGTRTLEAVRWPFFLRLLVEEAAEAGKLAVGMAALFTSCVRRALVREIVRENLRFKPGGLIDAHDYERLVSGRGAREPHELPERGPLFRKLAALAHGMQTSAIERESSQVRIGYDAALAVLDCAEAETVMRAAEDLGVLDEDRVADELMFCHQLVQEYFAARALAVKPDPGLVRVEWRSDRVSPTVDEVLDALAPGDRLPGLPQTGWEETTVLAAAMTGDPAAFVRGVMDANLALAGRIATQAEVQARLPVALLDELRWALVQRSRDPEADLRDRIACGYAVGDLGDPRFERREGPFGVYLLPPFVEIPGGVYPIGEDVPTAWSDSRMSEDHTEGDQVPRHQVAIARFEIGQFPVTNAEWECFVASGGYGDDRWWDTVDARRWQRGELADEGAKYNNRMWRQEFRDDLTLFDRTVADGAFPSQEVLERWREWIALNDEAFELALGAHYQPKRRTQPVSWGDEGYHRPSQPVVGVCWYEARAYCNWLSAQTGLAVRLLTEVEWEAAARGRAARIFPWGDEFDRLKANTNETHVRWMTPVGVFPNGDTPERVADLAGNVREWTSSLLEEYPGGQEGVQYRYPYDPTDGREDAEAPPAIGRTMRGGSWFEYGALAGAALRTCDQPTTAYYVSGLRLAVVRADQGHQSRRHSGGSLHR